MVVLIAPIDRSNECVNYTETVLRQQRPTEGPAQCVFNASLLDDDASG